MVESDSTDTRLVALIDAEAKAAALFDEIERRGLVTPGKTERELSDEVKALAGEMLGVHRFWHKRIVRSGINTLEPYRSNPPVLTLTEDDIVFFDFGPIFAEWEADFGRTYVVGDDPHKHKLAADLPRIWHACHDFYLTHPEVTGEQFYRHVLGLITEAGWGHGASHVGHMIGEFPHERVSVEEVTSYLTEGNTLPLRRPDAAGKPIHWILEIHLTDTERQFGGFFEQLLADDVPQS